LSRTPIDQREREREGERERGRGRERERERISQRVTIQSIGGGELRTISVHGARSDRESVSLQTSAIVIDHEQVWSLCHGIIMLVCCSQERESVCVCVCVIDAMTYRVIPA